MATFESDETKKMLRALARAHFEPFDHVIGALLPGLSLNRRVELSAAVADVRRLIHGDEAPPANMVAPSNVKRLVMVGRDGPAFAERSGMEMAVGPGWLQSGEDAPHIGQKFDGENGPRGNGAA